MKAALRYLWSTYISTCLAALGVVALISLAGSQVLKIRIMATYYYMLPMMTVIFVIIFSFNVTTIYRNMALSMNCLRRHFFWACQLAFVITALGGIAIVWLAGALPALTGMGYVVSDGSPALSGTPFFTRPGPLLFLLAVSLFLQPMGAALGGLYGMSKAWAMVCLMIVVLLGIAGTVLLLFVSDGTVVLPPAVTAGFLTGMAVICGVCEVYFWRSNAKTVVR